MDTVYYYFFNTIMFLSQYCFFFFFCGETITKSFAIIFTPCTESLCSTRFEILQAVHFTTHNINCAKVTESKVTVECFLFFLSGPPPFQIPPPRHLTVSSSLTESLLMSACSFERDCTLTTSHTRSASK